MFNAQSKQILLYTALLMLTFLCAGQQLYAQKRVDSIPVKPDSIVFKKFIQLDEVQIRMRRNYKKDSLALRTEYAKVFNYKAPGLKDLLISKNRVAKSFYPVNSTSSIAGLNVLALLPLLWQNKVPASKLKKRLLKEEEYHFVDQSFSKEKILSLTPLKGDSLIRFTEYYRPASAAARKMNDYEMMLYIKKSYQDFLLRKDIGGKDLF